MKKEIILQGGESLISTVAIYPDVDCRIYSEKKWLYCADDSGIFKLFDLGKSNKFKEILKITTGFKKGILSAIVFEDHFMEISKNEKENKAYVIVSFDDEKLPLQIYKINGDNAGTKIRDIPNPILKNCSSMDFYYDEILSKCFIVCGFKDCIKIYDLLLATWFSEFKVDSYVTSLKILMKKEKGIIKNLLLFNSGMNSIFLCDLSNSQVISQILIPQIKYVYDISIWSNNFDKEYALIACKNENSIKVVSFSKELQLFDYSKGTDQFMPINLRKILVKDKTTGIFKEHLCALLKDEKGANRKVLFY